ncbi:MAG TPA: hypothetical protein ENK57_09550 [Polyangiaceae bacterium]|nr:hypothetical protein [Polyangiaceae bacterium]
MTFWHRIEPNTIDTAVEEGTEARVADPLWLLARQWQLGEFKGEDAASPIRVQARAYSNLVDTFRNDAEEDAPVERLRTGHPLECRVETEAVLDGPGAVALAAEAGAQFLRRLAQEPDGERLRGFDWRAEFGFDHAADGLDLEHLPPRTVRRLELLEACGLDGRKLFSATRAQLGRVVSTPADAALVAPAYRAWRSEYGERFVEPGASGDCWLDERLEYTFSLGARTGVGEVVLAAEEYPGGHLDWYAFEVDPDDTHQLDRRAATRQDLDLLPQPAMFRGQGAPRWWEFEDRAVYFGNLSAGPADVARLVVAEFGALFSDDWFLIPLQVPVGSLNRVTRLDVYDVFGDRTKVYSTAVQDKVEYGEDRPWRWFELRGDRSVEDHGRTPWLFVPPALADQQNGRPVERVTLVRDEGANLGWAIEQAIELPTGEPMRRRRQWVGAQKEETAVGERDAEESDAWRYRMQTAVPPWWVPLVPEPTGEGAEVRLRRGRMQTWEEFDEALVGAKGNIVGVKKALRIFEEEVPRGGIQVTRSWQRARGADGSVHVWMARLKRPGRGDRGSGLEFDVIERG